MKIYVSNVYIYFCKDEIWQKNNIHDTQTFWVQDKTDNVLIGFAEFLDSLKESAKMVVHSKQIRQIICWKLSAFYGIIKEKYHTMLRKYLQKLCKN